MALKALNDSVGPHGLVPTLLVYGAYPRMVKDSAPSPSIEIRAKAIEKAMLEIKKIRAQRSINDALATRNGPNTLPILNLPLQSDVIVWRENKGWKGPYKLVGLDIDHQECIIEMPYGPTTFRATAVKPYFSEEEEKEAEKPETISDLDSDSQDTVDYCPSQNEKKIENTTDPVNEAKRGRGRPKGSKNKTNVRVACRQRGGGQGG
ncbi:hypothetical protein K3495_g13980 [Podosphaera aphanis]|nr:hypothetical protein K3495_g13980 [Podosphaera aphanis]